MSLSSPYQEHYYIGDGATTTFSFGTDFTALAEANVKCIIYFADGTNCTPTFTVDMTTGYITITTLTKPDGTVLTAPPAGSVVRVFRDTPEQQNVTASQLQNYTAKQLEKIFDSMVAMTQETSYTTEHKTLRLTEPQRDVSLQKLSEDEDQGILYWDEESGTIKSTSYGQDELKADVERANEVADEAKSIAQQTQGNLNTHTSNLSNPHQTSLEKLTDTSINNPSVGHVLRYNGRIWENTSTDVHVEWGEIEGNITDQTDLQNALGAKVNIDGTSIMTAPLKFMSGSVRGAVGPYFNGVGFWKLDSQGNLTQIATISDSRFIPTTTNSIDIGRSANTWKDLYLGGKAYVGTINNGYDISVPAYTGTMVVAEWGKTVQEGQMLLLDRHLQPVWKFASTYMSFSSDWRTDRTTIEFCGAVASDASAIAGNAYLGEVTFTDLPSGLANAEVVVEIMAGTDARDKVIVLRMTSGNQAPYQWQYTYWNGGSDTSGWIGFQPELPSQTGNSGKFLTTDGSDLSWATVDALPTQTGHAGEYLTTDGTDASWAAINVGSGYHPDLFAWEWSDALRNDVQWLRADTFSWQQGSVYKAAYKHLRNDTYNWYSWENNGTTIYTKKAYPEVGEKAYSDSALTTEVGEITAVTDTLDITVEKITVNNVVYDSVSGSNIAPTTETIAGVTVQYIPAEDGHKIVTDFHISEAEAVYAATGVAWYYIIDYGFKRFKLPRSKHRKLVGFNIDYNNGTSISTNTDFTCPSDGLVFISHYGTSSTGTLTVNSSSFSYFQSVGAGSRGCVSLPVSKGTVVKYNLGSGTFYPEIKQEQDTDQYKYLYFYVGEFTQTALENTAGITAETLNDKVDKGHQVIAFQAPTAGNNYTWYRKYVDGWVEQGGVVASMPSSKYQDVVFPVTMANINYAPSITAAWSNSATGQNEGVQNTTTTGMRVTASYAAVTVWWQVSGMAA